MNSQQGMLTLEISGDEEEIDSSISESFSILNDNQNELQTNRKIRILAIIVFIIQTLLYSLMYVTCKYAYYYNSHVNGFDYMFVRGASMIILSSTPIIWKRVNIFYVHPNYRLRLVGIMILGGISMPSLFFALRYLPAFKVSLIYSTLPIITSILGVFLLSEIMTNYDIVGIAGTFGGIFILTISKADSSASFETSELMQTISLLLTIFAGGITSLLIIFMRDFNKEHSYLLQPFYYSISLIIFSGGLLFAQDTIYNFQYYTAFDIIMFSLSGVGNMAGNQLLSYSYTLEKVSVLAPYGYLSPVFNLIGDLLLFEYSLSFTDLFGAMIVIFFLLMKLKGLGVP